ncbi:MAG: cyclic nucleotide-binding domain-containing protein [Terriglobia bacterium]
MPRAVRQLTGCASVLRLRPDSLTGSHSPSCSAPSARRPEGLRQPRRDVEWAYQDGTLYLLQCRAITTGKARSEAPPPGLPPHDPVAALRRVGLFADMDRRQAEQIARLLKERHFAKGETVIVEGSGGAAFFLIDSGEATVSRKGVHLATLGPGDYFGEIALIDGGPRSATVTAATDLFCYGLTFWEFRPLVEGNGAIAWKPLQALAKRLRAADPN